MRAVLTSLAFAAAGLFVASPVEGGGGVSGVVVPFIVPPGGDFNVDVTNCPVDTVTVTVEVSPQGGSALLTGSTAADGDSAHFDLVLPIDAPVGAYDVRIACLDDGDVELDSTQLTFDVAILALTLSPTSGPVGTAVTASGTGCPVGVTDVAFVHIEGASDDTPVWDPSLSGTSQPAYADGSFSVPFTVPSGSPLGENLVTVWCVSEGGEALAGPLMNTFMVTEATIPATGASSAPLLWLATAIVALGAALVAARRLSSPS